MTDVKTQRLSELAKCCLENENPGEGEQKIQTIVKMCRQRAHMVNVISLSVGIPAGVFFLAAVINFLGDIFFNWTRPLNFLIAGTLSAVSGSLALFGTYGRRSIQTRKRFFINRPYDIDLPNSIENLLSKLASGQIEAVLPVAEYGGATIVSLRGSDGKRYDTVLDPSVFENRYAPILLSNDWWDYSSVWVRDLDLNRPIYVIQEPTNVAIQNDPVSVAPYAPPVVTHWITRIPENRFSAFLDAVQQREGWEDEDAPEKVRIVLVEARKFSRANDKVGKKVVVAEIVRACEQALLVELKKNGPPEKAIFTGLGGKGIDGNSTEWMRQMLSPSGNYTYSWVRALAAEFTGRKSAGHGRK